MTIALLFPGQGSQKIGMGKSLANTYPAARNIFEEVDEALGEKLSNLIWEGGIEELTRTENAQPALMVTSIAALESLKYEGLKMHNVQFMAGHSLGEYTALCAAGSLALDDTARLLRTRGLAMRNAVLGEDCTMAAILGLDIGIVNDLVDNLDTDLVCDVANDNDPNQVVISGHRDAVSQIIDQCRDNGARRAAFLQVSAPFHSRLMTPAAVTMADALANVSINNPDPRVISNFTAQLYKNSNEIREHLVSQVTNTVRWRESMLWLAEHGISTALEVGSGNVLSGLLRRTVRSIKPIIVGMPEQVQEAIRFLMESNNA